MKAAAKVLAPLALLATILPPVLFLFSAMGEGLMKLVMLCGTILWFAAAPFWLRGGAD